MKLISSLASTLHICSSALAQSQFDNNSHTRSSTRQSRHSAQVVSHQFNQSANQPEFPQPQPSEESERESHPAFGNGERERLNGMVINVLPATLLYTTQAARGLSAST